MIDGVNESVTVTVCSLVFSVSSVSEWIPRRWQECFLVVANITWLLRWLECRKIHRETGDLHASGDAGAGPGVRVTVADGSSGDDDGDGDARKRSHHLHRIQRTSGECDQRHLKYPLSHQ